MIEYKGKSVFEGISIGKIKVISEKNTLITDAKVSDINNEIKKYQEALAATKKNLEELYKKALTTMSEDKAEIFNVHIMMLEDLDFVDLIMMNLTEGYNALYSITLASESLASMLKGMDDEYMQARANDVLDVANQLISNISGGSKFELDSESIIVASDILPSEIINFDKNKLLGIVTIYGSTSSHMAIIARSMSIPTLVDTKTVIGEEYNGKVAIIDSFNSLFIIDPSDEVLEVYRSRLNRLIEENKNRLKLIGKPDLTIDKKEVKIFANIGKSKDTKLALENDASGIGLFRSEFLYLESTDYPKEDYQFNEYKKVLEQMNGKSVVIRTMDVGADKQASYFNLPKEDNPALGLRSLRICFSRPEIMYTQLRALYRASIYGDLKIMVPMIISLEEVLWVKEMASKVKDDLKKEGIPFSENVELGIMIETPAAAIISDELAKNVDFFSIGTNDLTQYTLAIDRQNQSLDKIFNPKHKAILRLISLVVKNAHDNGIWCGICGELGRNMDLTEFFVGIGIDELSVSAPYVLPLREKLSQIDSTKVDYHKFID